MDMKEKGVEYLLDTDKKGLQSHVGTREASCRLHHDHIFIQLPGCFLNLPLHIAVSVWPSP